MKTFLLSLVVTLTISSGAFAQTPPEILKPYKEYRTAIDAGNTELARNYAYIAWQTSEDLSGESKLTGDLAQNFADIPTDEKDKNRSKAYERSIELSSFYGAEAGTTRIDRMLRLAVYYRTIGFAPKMFAQAKDLIEFAEENGLEGSTFVGEAHTLKAEYYVKKGYHKDTEKETKKALEIFKNAKDGIVTAQPILANLYSGFSFEGQDEPMKAALNYQKVMESIDGKLARDHPLTAQALGRWSYMRSRLSNEGRLDEAEQKGLCKCWPYDKQRNENLKPVDRVPPIMPRDAYRSGYSIVEFDLNDDGEVINPEILVSWPKEVFEDSTLKAIEQWKYTSKLPEESEDERQDLIVTLSYRLTDQSGNIIY